MLATMVGELPGLGEEFARPWQGKLLTKVASTSAEPSWTMSNGLLDKAFRHIALCFLAYGKTNIRVCA